MNLTSTSSLTPAHLAASAGRAPSRLVATLAALGLASLALASGPQGGQVVAGSAQINKNGNTTTIRAADRTIINWRSFNVAADQSVHFVQPSASSRVLNRVTGGDMTTIAGQLRANGIVYIVNPAGVYFTRGSVVNVGGIYAAAGNITNQAFLSGVNAFSNVSGVVENHGLINAQTAGLIGQRVANFGTINAPRGMVTLAAGTDVMVGEQNGQIFARVTNAAPGATGVTQAGTINAPGGRVALGAGDMYAMAIDHPGRTTAASIDITAGRGSSTQKSTVSISGTLDASSTTAQGGSITITGQQVGLFDATINASGATAGGTVKIGGDIQGQGSMPRADALYMSPGSTINADATTIGKGGTVVLWSDLYTNFQGRITARGGHQGGDGGFVETSGKIDLFATGAVSASADRGRAGTWLLDPTTVTISTDPTSNGGLSGGGVFTPDPVATANVNVTQLLTALQNGTSVTINTASAGAGDGDILLNAPLVGSFVSSVTLTLNAVRDIVISTGNNISAGGAGLSVVMNAGRNIDLNANITTGGGSATFTADRVQQGSSTFINAGAGDITFAGSTDYRFNTTTLTARNMTFNGDASAIGNASIDLNATGDITINAGFTAGSPGFIRTASTGRTILNTSSLITAGGIEFNNPVLLAADTRLSAQNGVRFFSTLDSNGATPRNLTIQDATTGGGGRFLGTVGSTNRLGTVVLGNAGNSERTFEIATPIFRVASLIANQAILLNSNTTISAENSATFARRIVSLGTARNLTIDTPSATILGNIGISQAAELNNLVIRGGSVTLGAPIIRAQSVQLDSNATLNASLAITATREIALNGTVDSQASQARNLTLAAPTVRFASNVGARTDARLGALVVGTGNNANTTTIAAAEINATTIDFRDNVLLDTNTTINATTSVDFQRKIDSAASALRELTVASASTTFSGEIGNATNGELGRLTTTYNSTAPSDVTQLNGSLLRARVVNLQDDVRLGQNTTVNATTSATFARSLSSTPGTPRDLVVNSTTTEFNGDIGQVTAGALGALTTDAAGTTRFGGLVSADTINIGDQATIAGSSITTTDEQIYNGAVLLAVNTTLTGSNITFNSTLNSQGTDRALTLNTTGNGVTRFNAPVGLLTPLASLTTNADGRTLLNGAQVITSGAQLYNDAVTLGIATTLSGNNLTFNGAIDSDGVARSLTLNTTGNGVTTFGAPVGATSRLLLLTTNSDGSTRIGSTSITTELSQTYNDILVLLTDVTMSGQGLSLLGGARSDFTNRALTLNSTNSSDTTLAGTLGGTTLADALLRITTNADGRTIINGPSIRTTNEAQFNDTTRLVGNTTFNTGSLTFNNTLDSNSATSRASMTVNLGAGGTLLFSQRVGGTNPLGRLTVDTAGRTRILASVDTSSAMEFNNAVLIGADLTLRDTGVAISGNPNTGVLFSSTLDSEGSPRQLTILVNSTANATAANPRLARIQLGSSVGATTRFSRLTLGSPWSASAAAATISAGIRSDGTRINNYALTINADRFVMARGQKLTVAGDLTLNAPTSAVLGDISTLGNMTINSPSITINRRPGGFLLSALPSGSGGSFLTNATDTGVDFVAGGSITFSSVPTATGDGVAPQFATPAGQNFSSTLLSFGQRSFGNLSAPLFNVGSTALDLRAAGPSNTNIATTIAGAAPRPTPADQLAPGKQLGQEQIQALADLGIQTKTMGREQLLDLLMGRTLLIDAPVGLTPVASDTRVTATRLSAAAVERTAALYRQLLIQETRDPATGEVTRVRRDDAVRGAIAQAWSRYTAAAGPRADALGFRAYLEAVPSEAEALSYIDQLRELFATLTTVGLAPGEVDSARGTILRAITPDSMSPATLDSAIQSRIMGTPVSMAP